MGDVIAFQRHFADGWEYDALKHVQPTFLGDVFPVFPSDPFLAMAWNVLVCSWAGYNGASR
jgi:hypothetical protein